MQYQLLPDLTEEEFASLKADIAARGVMVPVELDETGAVLDGHHRVRACAELGITEYPRIIRPGMTEDEKRKHVLALNLDRRHLNQQQKRELVAKLLVATPDVSNRQIAEAAKVSHPTVAAVRDELEATGKIYQSDRTTGADGKDRPAKRPSVVVDTPKQAARALELLDGGAAPGDSDTSSPIVSGWKYHDYDLFPDADPPAFSGPEELTVAWTIGLTGAYRRARIDEEIPDDHAYLRDVRQRKGIGHHFAQDTVVNVTAEILD